MLEIKIQVKIAENRLERTKLQKTNKVVQHWNFSSSGNYYGGAARASASLRNKENVAENSHQRQQGSISTTHWRKAQMR